MEVQVLSDNFTVSEPQKNKYANRQKDIKYQIDANDCWICISHIQDKDGYPKIRRNNKYLRLSRYIYKLYYGIMTIIN